MGIVSNGYWATEVENSIEWLKPLAGLVQDLSISSDRFHWGEGMAERVENLRSQRMKSTFQSGLSASRNPTQ